MTMEYHEIHHVLTPITASVPDVEFLREQIDTNPGTYDPAIYICF